MPSSDVYMFLLCCSELDSFCQVVVDDEVVAQTDVQLQKASPFFDDSFTLSLAHNFAFVSVRLNTIVRLAIM
jgi:hypothetical protein